MAPSVDTKHDTAIPRDDIKATSKVNHREPLKVSGVLPTNYFEVTPVIGREYPDVQLSQLMNSPQRDAYLRDLAITGRWKAFRNHLSNLVPTLQLIEFHHLRTL